MKAIGIRIFFLIISLLFISGDIVISQIIYGWRNTDRSGIYNESGLLKSWPSGGPSLLWESHEAGTGFSSVTVTSDDIYITGRKGDMDVLTAFSQDGKKKWEVPYGKSSNSNYPDSRCTPTVSFGRIFLVSGHGDMVCVSKEGKTLWAVNYYQKYEGVHPRFGISESPLVVDNIVIGTPGGNKAAMVAYNVKNGDVVWETSPLNNPTGYVNPLLIEYGGKKMIITLSVDYIFAVDATSGRLIWKYNYGAENSDSGIRKNHTTTPVFRDGFLFVASGYGHTSVMLKLSPDGSVPQLVWKNSDIDPHVGGMVLLGNNIYASTFETTSFGKWICVDWTTGKTLWIEEWYNKGSVISADGMLYIFEEKSGHVGLVKPGNKKLEVISEFVVSKGSGPYWSHPVIDKGRLFIRHGEYLAVYSVN